MYCRSKLMKKEILLQNLQKLKKIQRRLQADKKPLNISLNPRKFRGIITLLLYMMNWNELPQKLQKLPKRLPKKLLKRPIKMRKRRNKRQNNFTPF